MKKLFKENLLRFAVTGENNLVLKEELEKAEVQESVFHACASHVRENRTGRPGRVKSHTLLKNGTVTHYTVQFKEEVVRNIPVEALTILKEGHHAHAPKRDDLEEEEIPQRSQDSLRNALLEAPLEESELDESLCAEPPCPQARDRGPSPWAAEKARLRAEKAAEKDPLPPGGPPAGSQVRVPEGLEGFAAGKGVGPEELTPAVRATVQRVAGLKEQETEDPMPGDYVPIRTLPVDPPAGDYVPIRTLPVDPPAGDYVPIRPKWDDSKAEYREFPPLPKWDDSKAEVAPPPGHPDYAKKVLGDPKPPVPTLVNPAATKKGMPRRRAGGVREHKIREAVNKVLNRIREKRQRTSK